MKHTNQELHDQLNESIKRNTELRNQITELQKDTKRLDWLLDMISASSTNTAFEIFGAVHNRFTREHIDAMQETHRGESQAK